MKIMDVGLPSRPEAVRVAREAVSRLRGHMDDGSLDNLRLLISEVVTNSVRHAPKAANECIHLKVFESADVVRVEVDDPGLGFDPDVHEPRDGQTSGWGLFLVDKLASAWGVEASDATRVWFAIPRSQRQPLRR